MTHWTFSHAGVAADAVAAPRAEPAVPQPTPRQLEVLALLAQGEPNKRIAAELGIAERTVKLHVTALMQSVGARNRTHLAVIARDLGLV